MNQNKSIQIFHVIAKKPFRLSEKIFAKLSTFYKIQVKKTSFEDVEKIVQEEKVHLLIFDNIKPEKINYSEIDPIIKKNPRLHLVMVYKQLPQKRQTLCYEKHIDYIVNGSFDDKYVVSKIKNILRRRSSKYFADEIYINFKNLKIDISMGEIYLNDILVETTNKEFKLIRELLRNQDNFISKKELFKRIWKYEEDTSRILDQYIHRIRKKIGQEINIIFDRKKGFKLF